MKPTVHQVGQVDPARECDPRLDRPLGRRTVGRSGSAVAVAQLRVPESCRRTGPAAMSPLMALLDLPGKPVSLPCPRRPRKRSLPTLVVHRKGEAIPIEYAREVAAGIHRRESSNSRASITGRPSATSSRSPARSRKSSPGSGRSTYPTGCWQPYCSPTSSIRRGMPPGSGTAVARVARAPRRSHPHRNQPLSRARRTKHRRRFSCGIRRPDARTTVCDHGRGADA